MTPQELKNSILQLAIQGKLVEQRPEEGTAEELYREIQKEKQTLIKAGKIKKEKPLPEISEYELPFEIPENWKWVRLGNAISLLSGTDFKPEEYNDKSKGIPYITGASSLTETGVLVSRWTESPRIIAEYGDVLLVCKGSGYGKCVICDIEKAHIARQIMAVKRIESIEMQYVVLFIKSNLNQIKANGQGVIPGIDRVSVLSMCFPLPPLAEQKRIVAKIEELLPLIERYEKAWTRLEDFNKRFPGDMQKSILQMAIQGKLVEQRHEEGTGEELYREIQKEKQTLIKAGKIKKEKPLPEITEEELPFDIPESWKWVRMGNAIALLSGTDFKPEEYNDQSRGIPYITGASSLTETGVFVNRWTEFPRIIAEYGDVLLVCKGSGYGKTVICDVERAHIARQIMAVKKMESLDMLYILFFIRANLRQIKANGQGVIPGVDRESILSMCFPLPPLAEQKRIVARLGELLPLCGKLK